MRAGLAFKRDFSHEFKKIKGKKISGHVTSDELNNFSEPMLALKFEIPDYYLKSDPAWVFFCYNFMLALSRS